MPFRIIKVLPGETDTYTKKEKLREGKEPLTEKEVRSSVNIFYGTNDKDLAIGYIYKLTPSFLSNGDPDGFTCKIECKQTKKKESSKKKNTKKQKHTHTHTHRNTHTHTQGERILH